MRQQPAVGNSPFPTRGYLACPVTVGALSPDFCMQMGPAPPMNRRIPVIPASKRRRVHATTYKTNYVRSLKAMLERRPQVEKGDASSAASSDSEAPDKDLEANADNKKGTNMFYIIRAVDRMLMHGGFGGLQTWIDDIPQSTVLSRTEYRYELKNLPPFEDHHAEAWQRWCVEDTATGKRRFEVPATRGDHDRPLMSVFCDEDGSQISLLQGLMHGAGGRIWTFPDPFHRIWNDTKLALQEAGLWGDVYERLHCENLPCGPFKTASWWREMQEVSEDHFKYSNRHNELFRQLYPELEVEAVDAGAVKSPLGSDLREEEVWTWLKSHAKMQKAHRVVKTKTWFEPLAVIVQGLKVHTAYLYILCILCQDQGHMPTIADMPVHGGALSPALVEELPGDTIHSKKTAGAKDCQKLRSLIHRCHNNCVAACHLQGDPDSKPRGEIVVTVCGPVWRSYAGDYKYLKEGKQVKMKHENAALSGYDIEARKIFGNMANESFICTALSSNDANWAIVPDNAYRELREQLQELHGSVASSSSGGGAHSPAAPGASAPAGGALSPAARPKIVRLGYHSFQVMAAERVHVTWRLIVALVRQRCKSGGRFRFLPPGQFALLIAKDRAKRAIGLEIQKRTWM